MNVYIIGAATTKFGELWGVSSRALAKQAVSGALADAGLNRVISEHYLWEICSPVCWEVRNIWGVLC